MRPFSMPTRCADPASQRPAMLCYFSSKLVPVLLDGVNHVALLTRDTDRLSRPGDRFAPQR